MKHIITAIMIFFVFANYSCKKCKKKESNPCQDQFPVSAEFKVTETSGVVFPESLRDLWLDLPCDTFISSAGFNAIEDNAEYTWYIGSKIYNQRSFSLDFSQLPSNTGTYVSLAVKKSPNKNCFPSDDGYDSITKFIFKNGISPFPIGKFEYLNPSTNLIDTFEMNTRYINGSEYLFYYNYPFVLDSIRTDNANLYGYTSYKQKVSSFMNIVSTDIATHYRDRWVNIGNGSFKIYIEWYQMTKGNNRVDILDTKQSQFFLARKIN